jgi:hypothetical protein
MFIVLLELLTHLAIRGIQAMVAMSLVLHQHHHKLVFSWLVKRCDEN